MAGETEMLLTNALVLDLSWGFGLAMLGTPLPPSRSDGLFFEAPI